MNYSYIKFNKNLIENEYTTITYTGYLFENNSDIVSIIYGFDDNWVHTTEQKMTKGENGFTVDVKIQNYKTFNFCFKNSNNEWDNNYYKNYTSPISKQESVEIEQDFIIDENVVNEILENLVEFDLSNSENIETNETSTLNETFEVIVQEEQPTNIEESFVNAKEELSLEKDIENLFSEIYSNTNNTQEVSINYLENINVVSDLVVEKQEPEIIEQVVENKVDEKTKFDMDSLIDEILTPIAESSIFENEDIEQDILQEVSIESPEEKINTINKTSTNINEINSKTVEINDLVEEFENNEEPLIDVLNNNENTSLIEIDSEDNFIVSPRSLSKFYMFKKKVKLAFYKLFVSIPKLLSKNLSENESK